ncbi:pseudouridine synthase [Oceanobacillus manasiensis]|uniref:pseudouridine synthase n=1 Tax=Oceanobacillus manasiensis TaxID=586413 RepID=UPI0005A9D1EF|nr:pseudouridine synthase [Oceanobacillus manasiensis]
MRVDKLLANSGYGSRKEVKSLLKSKQVTLNGVTVKDGSTHLNPDTDNLEVNNKKVNYEKYIYLMMNKPPGYLSATKDARDKTIIDLLNEEAKVYQPFPVGRLDKDTEGLLLLTNDGQLAHDLTSPKKNVKKKYAATIDGEVLDEHVEQFRAGIVLKDGYQAKPAELEIIHADKTSEIIVTITEGKFHQVKRMFEAIDQKVLYLKRLKMGELELDKSLELGSYRPLTEQEKAYCLSIKR